MKYRIALMLLAVVGLVCSASAKVVFNQDLTIPAQTVTNPCTGALLVISGTIHVLVGVTTDNAGGVHVLLHSNAEGLTATDQATGDVYHFYTQDGTSNSDMLPLGGGIFQVKGHEVPAGSEGADDNSAGFTFDTVVGVGFLSDGTPHVKFGGASNFQCTATGN